MKRKASKRLAPPPPPRPDLLEISLFVVIALESLLFWPDFPNAYTTPKIVAILIGAAVLLPQYCNRLLRNQATCSPLLFAVFGAILVAISVATIRSMSPAVSFWGGDWRRMGLISQFTMMAIALAVQITIGRDFRKWKRLLGVIAVIGVISGAYGLLQWAGWDPILPSFVRQQILSQFGGRYRSPGTVGQSTYFGNYLLYPLFASIAFTFLETKRVWRIGAAIGAVVIGAAIIFAAAARASILGCGIGLAVMATIVLLSWMRQFTISRKHWIVALSLSVAGLAATFFIGPRIANIGTDSEAIGRILIWHNVTERMLPDLWMRGTGPGMFRAAYARYRLPDYGLFGPDVHWETPHDIVLDRFAEQGIWGLIAFLAMAVVFARNVVLSLRASSDKRHLCANAAFGCGGLAAFISNLLNGEVITTTFYLYLWFALSFASYGWTTNKTIKAASSGLANRLRTALVGVAVVISLALFTYAVHSWSAEGWLAEGRKRSGNGDVQGLLASADAAEAELPYIGPYHLEFTELIDSFLQDRNGTLDPASKKRLTESGIQSGLWAKAHTDRPMLALVHLVALGDASSDARTDSWLAELQQIDPSWYRPHELAARLLIRKRKVADALREATIALEIAPYSESTAQIWRQLIAVRNEFGTELK